MDPADPLVKLRAGLALARKTLGFRYLMNVVPLNPAPVRGSHGRLPDDPADGPVLLGPFDGDAYAATEVKDLLVGLAKEAGARRVPWNPPGRSPDGPWTAASCRSTAGQAADLHPPIPRGVWSKAWS